MALHIIVWQTFVLQVEGKIVSSLFAILSLLHFIIRFMTIHLDDETGEWGPLTAFHSAKPAITKVLSGAVVDNMPSLPPRFVKVATSQVTTPDDSVEDESARHAPSRREI